MLYEQNPPRIPPWGSATIIQWAADISMVHKQKKPFSVKEKSQHDNKERKTRLELATPTLARLCSTN